MKLIKLDNKTKKKNSKTKLIGKFLGYQMITEVEYFKKFRPEHIELLKQKEYKLPKRKFFSKFVDDDYLSNEEQKNLSSESVKLLLIKDAFLIPYTDFLISQNYAIHTSAYDSVVKDLVAKKYLKTISIKNKKLKILRFSSIKIDKGISLFGFVNGNWCHFIYETISKLILIDKFKEYDDYPILIEENLGKSSEINKRFYILLDKFNLKKREIIFLEPRGGAFFVKDLLYIPSFNHHMHNENPSFCEYKKYQHLEATQIDKLNLESLKILNNSSINKLGTKHKKPSYVYFSRNLGSSYNNYRSISNLAELENLLRSKNFINLDPLTQELDDVISTLNSAKVIVSQTGAHLANLILCKPTKLILFSCKTEKPYAFFHSYFYNVLSYLGFEVIFIFGDPENKSINSRFHVEISDLKNALKSLNIEDFSRKRVALIGTSFSSIPILKSLQNDGYHVTTIGYNPTDPCHLYSNLSIYVDYSKKEELLEIIKDHKFDYIVPSCNDSSYNSASYVAEVLQITGFDSYQTTMLLHTKNKFRKYLSENGYNCPKYYSEETIEETISNKAQNQINFPLIIKPNNSFSGIGIKLASNIEELRDVIFDLKNKGNYTGFVAEEYVEGNLFSHTAFIEDQKIYWDEFAEEYCKIYQYQVSESKHPCQTISADILQSVRKQISQIIADLNLKDGLLHTQFICNGKDFFIIETMRRAPGDLYGIAVEKSTGIDYFDAYAAKFVGKKFDFSYNKTTDKKAIKRKIIGSKDEIPFSFGLEFENYSKFDFIPLKLSGEILKAAPFDKYGVIFYEDKDDNKSQIKILITK